MNAALAIAMCEVHDRPARRVAHNLTPPQVAILQWTAHGKRSMDIALIMGLGGTDAVDAHFRRIMEKTGTVSRASAVAWALRRGIIH